LLQRLLETKTQHCATIWNIYVSHGSALIQINVQNISLYTLVNGNI